MKSTLWLSASFIFLLCTTRIKLVLPKHNEPATIQMHVKGPLEYEEYPLAFSLLHFPAAYHSRTKLVLPTIGEAHYQKGT